MKNIILTLFCSILLTSCIEQRMDIPDEVIGLAPIYASEGWAEISVTGPQNIENLGKIYYKNPYIYATERARGIHVIDNTDPTDPVPVAFIQITGNADLSIKGNVLYANNVNDLVALDISDLNDVQVIDRLEGVYKVTGSDFPEGYEGFFECVKPDLGEVVGWFETTLRQPECWR
jgi:hypothetical protein